MLKHIERYGSISAAARAMGVSYRAAWRWIAAMNEVAKQPLVETVTGGKGGGGARLTPAGQAMLRAFGLLEDRINELGQRVNAELEEIFSPLLR